jgi:hypothetical protein
MTVKRTVTHGIINPTLEDLRVLVNVTTDAAPDTPVRIKVTPRDRPFDNEQRSIEVSYEVTV